MKQLLDTTKIYIKSALKKDIADIYIPQLDQKIMDDVLDTLWRKRKLTDKYIIATNNHLQVLDSLKVIKAGGGIVVNEFEEILFILRKGHWDLPKGKQEKNETIELSALREVEEETGVSNLKLIKHITNSYHWYSQNKKWRLKESFWFYMTAKKQTLIPQIEEEIEQAKWISLTDIPLYYNKMYPNIKSVIKLFLKELD